MNKVELNKQMNLFSDALKDQLNWLSAMPKCKYT